MSRLSKIWPWCLIVLYIQACSNEPPASVSEEEFNKHVRSTPALSPEEERKLLKVPEGFDIQLFAAEPDIGKPLNMAFDGQGRMWLTQSNAYPFPDTTGNSDDRISILEDTDGDGRADKFTVFADGLNIPIGIVPVRDGAIAYSIPAIYHFLDEDGDNRSEKRKALYQGFQYNDTHGMINNLVRSWDGWIHADHGFANTSAVAGTDGDTIVMTSGNTFRFRTDGSRVEFTTTGRVNPYGYAYDEMGYTYSVDCHSSPIYQLVRGADYPHFGKQPTGIGFGPALMPHDYGSTALAGLEYYLADQFPADYQNSFFLGDVVKCRVYRSTMTMNGTTPEIQWQPEFVVSDDPWFRPVDVKLGPDGALYIADFYNRIIGHYEVPLDHEGRDRQRGRIWRISYKGDQKATPPLNLDAASLDELIATLAHPNLPLRMSAADQVVDHHAQAAVHKIIPLLRQPSTPAIQYVQGLWILYRLQAFSDELALAGLNHSETIVRVHTLRILFESTELSPTLLARIYAGLDQDNPHVLRQSVMVLAQHPKKEYVRKWLSLSSAVPREDTHLAYVFRQGLRDHFRQGEIGNWALQQQWTAEEADIIADILPGVYSSEAALFLLQYFQKQKEAPKNTPLYAYHMAIHLPSGKISEMIQRCKQLSAGEPQQASFIYESVHRGLAEKARKPDRKLNQWGRELASSILQSSPSPQSTEEDSVQQSRQLIFAAQTARTLQMKALLPELKILLNDGNMAPAVRTAAAEALLFLEDHKALEQFNALLDGDETDPELRRNLVLFLSAHLSSPTALLLLEEHLESFPYEVQQAVALAMADHAESIAVLFRITEQGGISPRILLETRVQERLKETMREHQRTRWQQLTIGVKPPDEAIQKTINQRLADFSHATSNPVKGQELYLTHCASCHQMNGQGGNIGPQLDAIGNWGARALAEKILDPNRNISKAFKTYDIQLSGGERKTGLFRREAGQTLVFANATGQEFSLNKNNISQQKLLPFTLMPDHFAELIPEEDFYDLLSFLLNEH